MYIYYDTFDFHIFKPLKKNKGTSYFEMMRWRTGIEILQDSCTQVLARSLQDALKNITWCLRYSTRILSRTCFIWYPRTPRRPMGHPRHACDKRTVQDLFDPSTVTPWSRTHMYSYVPWWCPKFLFVSYLLLSWFLLQLFLLHIIIPLSSADQSSFEDLLLPQPTQLRGLLLPQPGVEKDGFILRERFFKENRKNSITVVGNLYGEWWVMDITSHCV